jgi:hypothetical protein
MGQMNDQTKAAFAGATDTCKQLITLATGLLALEITFAREFFGFAQLKIVGGLLIVGSWVALLVSVVGGTWTLLALTGWLGSDSALTQAHIRSSNVRIPATVQIGFFALGLSLTVAFAIFGRW